MTSLPEGWTFAIEQHILKPEMVNLLETEMEDVARGGADEFFFRHPIPEHDAVTAAASGVAAVGHSEGEAVKVAGDEVIASLMTNGNVQNFSLLIPWTPSLD